MKDAIHTAAGETWTAGLRVVAYDGALTAERVQDWQALKSGS
jgi:hypothetical protein